MIRYGNQLIAQFQFAGLHARETVARKPHDERPNFRDSIRA